MQEKWHSKSSQTFMWMFLTALILTAKIWKQPKCPSAGRWTNCGTSHTMGYYSLIHKNPYGYMRPQGWLSNTVWWVEEARHKRLIRAGLASYDILGKAELHRNRNQIEIGWSILNSNQSFPGAGGRKTDWLSGAWGNFQEEDKVLYLDWGHGCMAVSTG